MLSNRSIWEYRGHFGGYVASCLVWALLLSPKAVAAPRTMLGDLHTLLRRPQTRVRATGDGWFHLDTELSHQFGYGKVEPFLLMEVADILKGK